MFDLTGPQLTRFQTFAFAAYLAQRVWLWHNSADNRKWFTLTDLFRKFQYLLKIFKWCPSRPSMHLWIFLLTLLCWMTLMLSLYYYKWESCKNRSYSSTTIVFLYVPLCYLVIIKHGTYVFCYRLWLYLISVWASRLSWGLNVATSKSLNLPVFHNIHNRLNRICM